MVRAREQKLRAAGDRAEFSDLQLVPVDGIMIQNVVSFELLRIVREIVVYGIIPDFDIFAANDILQIHRPVVPAAGIDLRLIRHDTSSSLFFLIIASIC